MTLYAEHKQSDRRYRFTCPLNSRCNEARCTCLVFPARPRCSRCDQLLNFTMTPRLRLARYVRPVPSLWVSLPSRRHSLLTHLIYHTCQLPRLLESGWHSLLKPLGADTATPGRSTSSSTTLNICRPSLKHPFSDNFSSPHRQFRVHVRTMSIHKSSFSRKLGKWQASADTCMRLY